MASHSRDPHLGKSRRPMSRVACTLALASAASVSLLSETAQAEPQPTTSEVKAKVDALYHEAEQASEQYNGAKEQADAARAGVDDLQDELARKTARLNVIRDALGSLAAAQYRTGGIAPTVQLALSSTPEAYLERASLLDRLGSHQNTALAQLTAQREDIAETRGRAGQKLATLKAAENRLADRKRTVQTKLGKARDLLARLTAAQRAAIRAADTAPSASEAATPAASRSTTRAPLGSVPAPSSRAAQAVAFAYRALGLPYVWGATGPGSFDCSGLTQAAWKSAGVSLPRTTYTQINAGTRVSESQLRPGDLVFFYSGVSHVGIYIGNGQMIHAPHPGAPVRVAPIDEMPFAGATRPG